PAALIDDRFEGGVHTGRMMRALLDRARAAGVTVWTGATVDRLAEEEGGVRIDVGELPLRAARVAVCTNAFTRALLPDLELSPGRGQVLVTAPCAPPFRGVFHMEEGYWYFREIDGRVIFGGGRNLDLEGEATTELAVTERLQGEPERRLRAVILP